MHVRLHFAEEFTEAVNNVSEVRRIFTSERDKSGGVHEELLPASSRRASQRRVEDVCKRSWCCASHHS